MQYIFVCSIWHVAYGIYDNMVYSVNEKARWLDITHASILPFTYIASANVCEHAGATMLLCVCALVQICKKEH